MIKIKPLQKTVQIQLFGHNFRKKPWNWKSKVSIDLYNQIENLEVTKYNYLSFQSLFCFKKHKRQCVT